MLAATLAAASALALAATLASASAATAAAPTPSLTIAHTFGGTIDYQPAPTFTGTTNDVLDPVTLRIYAGASAAGSPVQTSTVEPAITRLLPLPSEASWTATPASALGSGEFTAVAEQANPIMHTIRSPALTFTVDASAPAVHVSAPAAGAVLNVSTPTFSGTVGQAKGDRQSVTLAVYAGGQATGSPVAPPLVLGASGGAWTSGASGPQLANGIYTAQVSQADELGDVGVSTVTFAIDLPDGLGQAIATSAAGGASPPPAHPGAQSSQSPQSSSSPDASFQWFPANPHAGEPVVLASTSTDSDSALTGFAWDLAGTGAFSTGGAALRTSFASAGAHVVRLRVTDARGLSSVASQTIAVSPAAPKLMQPFPVVRIADTVSRLRVKVSLLTVQAPVGATVTVSCRGPGCPASRRDTVAASRRSPNRTGALVPIAFRRFERALRSGASLQIVVSEPGEVGKYTRFSVRRGKLPVRVDECASAASATAIACPLR